ncbi:hypothetical protein A3C39_02720 [Candidatus Saccharibacteria bacterium RIFCSPHIGHO2_02_FULL_46_12]|nr:MAG: hypothetical protein A3C39_02720 [Candidatus Saccharibacteria bacterium RIFCSPHIGHO2_02_FULL_46_12]
MDASVRCALTEEELGQAIAMAFANAQQELPPETAMPLMRRFEVELRRVVGADMSEASTIAPPIS